MATYNDGMKMDMAQSVMTGPRGGDWSFRKEIERMSNTREREVSGLTLALQKPPDTYKRLEQRIFSAPRRTGNWQNVAVEETNTVTSYATQTTMGNSAIEPATDPGSATVKCNIYLPRPLEKKKRKGGKKKQEHQKDTLLEVCVNGDETVGELIEKLPYYFNFEGIKLSDPIKALVLADDDGDPDDDCPHLDSGTRVAAIGFTDLAIVFKDGRKQRISRAVNPDNVIELSNYDWTRDVSPPAPSSQAPGPSSCNPSSFFSLGTKGTKRKNRSVPANDPYFSTARPQDHWSPPSSPELGAQPKPTGTQPKTRSSKGPDRTKKKPDNEMGARCDLGCVIS